MTAKTVLRVIKDYDLALKPQKEKPLASIVG